jgi:hypothetical protein
MIKIKSLIRVLCALIILIPLVSATTIDNPSMVFQITNANISFPTSQTYTTIGTGSDYISLNSKTLQLTPSVQTTVKINTFNTAGDAYNLSLQGASAGTLNLYQEVLTSNAEYNFFKNAYSASSPSAAYTFSVRSNTTGWVLKDDIPITTSEDVYTYPEAYSLPGGGGGGLPPAPTPTATPGLNNTNNTNGSIFQFPGTGGGVGVFGNTTEITKEINNRLLNFRLMSSDPLGRMFLVFLLILAIIMFILGAWSKKTHRTTMIWGILLGGIAAYGLGIIS